MKILITESQQKKLVEGLEYKMSYDPSKIDQILNEATQLLEKLKIDYEKYYELVYNLSIMEVAGNYIQYERLLEKMKANKEYFYKKYEQYYSVVEVYDFFDRPNNVKKLEKIATEIDSILLDFDDVIEILDSLKDFAEKIKQKI